MQNLKKLWSKKWFRRLVYLLIFILLVVLLLKPVMRAMGRYLVADDPLEKTELVVVLGGNSYERGLAGAEVHRKFPDQAFVTTGGNVPMQLLALDTSMYEAELTRHLMVKKGVPVSQITALTTATSTQEEAKEVLDYARKNNIHSITVISSTYHLRRVRWTFEKQFDNSGIELRFYGAVSEEFEPEMWWKSESGLVTTNNEYIKLMYYLLKY